MARRRKIDHVKLGELIQQGKQPEEIAPIFGVSVSAVYKATQQYRINFTRELIRSHADEAARQYLDINDQLLKINRGANRLYDRLMAAAEVLEPDCQWRKIIELEPLLEGRLSLLEAILKVSAEIKDQVSLVVKAATDIAKLQAESEFQQEIKGLLKDAPPGIRDWFIGRLKQTGLVCGSVDGL